MDNILKLLISLSVRTSLGSVCHQFSQDIEKQCADIGIKAHIKTIIEIEDIDFERIGKDAMEDMLKNETKQTNKSYEEAKKSTKAFGDIENIFSPELIKYFKEKESNGRKDKD